MAHGHKLLVVSATPSVPVHRDNPYMLYEVPVSSWGSLDSRAPWQEYAQGITAAHILGAVRDHKPEVAMLVDWSALPAWRAIQAHLKLDIGFVWLNYRVFSRTEAGPGLDLVRTLEYEAMHEAMHTFVLSRSDQKYLIDHVYNSHVDLQPLRGEHENECTSQSISYHHDSSQLAPNSTNKQCTGVFKGSLETHSTAQGMDPHLPTVLLCALREDMKQIPPPSDVQMMISDPNADVDTDRVCAFNTQRPYITSVVRLSKEKEPERFVRLIAELHKRGALQEFGLTPLLVGPAQDEYAQGIKSWLRSVYPGSEIHEEFMGPHQLANVYSRSRLNIHPATYDAFGMTIAEAASQGCPSLVHDGAGAVGATDLLRHDHQEVFLTHMEQDDEQRLADTVVTLLKNHKQLAVVGRNACHRARSWDEQENAAELIRVTQAAMMAAQHQRAVVQDQLVQQGQAVQPHTVEL